MADPILDNDDLKDSVSLTNELVDNTRELGRLYKQNKENIKGLDSALSNMLSNSKGLNKQFENLTGLSDRLEKLEIKKIPLTEAIEMAHKGEIKDCLSVVSLLKVPRFHQC